MFFLRLAIDFYLNVWYTYSMKKIDSHVVYGQHSHDAEFSGTLAECEAWFKRGGLTIGKSFFIEARPQLTPQEKTRKMWAAREARWSKFKKGK